MHRAHRAENHSLRLSLSPFSGLSSFSPWLAPSCYKKKKVFPSSVSSSQGPFQRTGQEAQSDFKGVLSAAAAGRGGRSHGEDEDGGMRMLRCRQARGSQRTGHLGSFCSKDPAALSTTLQALASAARLAAPNLRRRDKSKVRPTLCSWRAGSCSPGSPELPLLQPQAPLTAERASPTRQQAQHLLLHQFPPSAARRHHSASPQSCAQPVHQKNRASSGGMSVPPPVPALPLRGRRRQPPERVLGREDGRAGSPSSPVLVRGHLNTRHAISKGSWRWSPAPAWSC